MNIVNYYKKYSDFHCFFENDNIICKFVKIDNNEKNNTDYFDITKCNELSTHMSNQLSKLMTKDGNNVLDQSELKSKCNLISKQIVQLKNLWKVIQLITIELKELTLNDCNKIAQFTNHTNNTVCSSITNFFLNKYTNLNKSNITHSTMNNTINSNHSRRNGSRRNGSRRNRNRNRSRRNINHHRGYYDEDDYY